MAESFIGPKPLQKPHPPLYLAAYSAGAMRGTARFANGWNPAGILLGRMTEMMAGIQAMASQFGRDKLALVVRANCHLTARPCPEDRRLFVGNVDQIAQDVKSG